MSSLLDWVKKRKDEPKTIRPKSPVPARRHSASWIRRFLQSKENRYYCKIDKDFLEDTFSHYGACRNVKNYKLVIRMMLDKTDTEASMEASASELRTLERRAAQLYALLHPRYIITRNGLHRMKRMYKKNHWGLCPRVGCMRQALLPIGIYDDPDRDGVKLYCCSCGLLYRSISDSKIDGSCFGTTFPHLFFMSFPELMVPRRKLEYLVPTIYGFKLHKTWKSESSKTPKYQRKSCSF